MLAVCNQTVPFVMLTKDALFPHMVPGTLNYVAHLSAQTLTVQLVHPCFIEPADQLEASAHDFCSSDVNSAGNHIEEQLVGIEQITQGKIWDDPWRTSK